MADPATHASTRSSSFTSDLIRIDTTNRGGGDCARAPGRRVRRRAARRGRAGAPAAGVARRGRTNVVARLEGTDPAPTALLVHGHLDVVPAEPADWAVHPFSGEVRDGVVWGRGAVDMKNMDAMMLAVVRAWARARHRRPARDVVLAFTADEEDSAEAGSDWLAGTGPTCSRAAPRASASPAPTPSTPDGGVRLYPIARRRARHGLAQAHRARDGRATAPGSTATTRSAALAGRRRPDRRARVAGAAHSRPCAPPWPGIAAALGQRHRPRRARLRRRRALARARPGRRAGRGRRCATAPTRPCSTPATRSTSSPGPPPRGSTGGSCPAARRSSSETLDRLTGDRRRRGSSTTARSPLEAPVDSPTFAAMRGRAAGARTRTRTSYPCCIAGGTDAKQFSRLGITGYGFAPLRLPRGLRLLGGVPRRRRAGAGRRAGVRRPGARPVPASARETWLMVPTPAVRRVAVAHRRRARRRRTTAAPSCRHRRRRGAGGPSPARRGGRPGRWSAAAAGRRGRGVGAARAVERPQPGHEYGGQPWAG